MPWTHCDIAFILDTEDCPSCGFTKAEWTVEFERTRTFVIPKRAKLIVQVVRVLAEDAAEEAAEEPHTEPVAGVAWHLAVPGGKAKEGTTNAEGESLIKAIRAGTVTLSFPDLDPQSFLDTEPLEPFLLEQQTPPFTLRVVLTCGDLGFHFGEDDPAGEIAFELEEDDPPGDIAFELEENPDPGRLSCELEEDDPPGDIAFELEEDPDPGRLSYELDQAPSAGSR
jgi:hypothetical protein